MSNITYVKLIKKIIYLKMFIFICRNLLTLKKSKNGILSTKSPYFSWSCLKKNIRVILASTIAGCLRDMTTRSSLSWRLSRPLQNPFSILSSQVAGLLPITCRTSKLCLLEIYPAYSSNIKTHSMNISSKESIILIMFNI